MRYIFMIMVTFIFVGCLSDDKTSVESVEKVSEDIADTNSLQPNVDTALQPPKPPAL
ncbi:MAG: hypothetical protein U9P38_06810 [Campylobacterota bacterium]|nr:hypothetical protein [Campylobacterota bacterium]